MTKKSIHNAKGINPTGGYNPCKHICNQYTATEYTKKQKQTTKKTLLVANKRDW